MDNSDPAEDDPYSEAIRAIDCLRDGYNSNSTSEDGTKRNYDACSEAEAEGETEETSAKKQRNNRDVSCLDDPVLSEDTNVLGQMWGPAVAGDMFDFSDLLLEEVSQQSVNEHLQNLLTPQGYNESEDSNSLTACSEINVCLPSTSTCVGGENVPNISHVISDIVQPVAGDMFDFSDLLLLDETQEQSVNELFPNLLTPQGHMESVESDCLTATAKSYDCLPSTSKCADNENIPISVATNIDVLEPHGHEDISSQQDLIERDGVCENDIDNKKKNATPCTEDHHGDASENADIDILMQAIEAVGGLHEQVGGGHTSEQETQEMFQITERPGLRSNKFKTAETMFVINLNRQIHDSLWSANLDVLTRAMQNVLDILNSRLRENDLVRIYIGQQGLETPIFLHLRPLHELTVQAILDQIEKVLQSKDMLRFDETFEIHVAYIELPKGSGAYKKSLDIMTQLKNKRSVAVIQNNDHMCLARAIVVGRSKIEDSDRTFTKVVRSKLQDSLAKELCEKAGVDPDKPAGLADVPRFEKVIGRRICVISAEHLNKPIYRGDQTISGTKNIYIYFHHSHFDTILNVKGFYGYGYYCHKCQVPYYRQDNHLCENICPICLGNDCRDRSTTVFCKACNRYCSSSQCYEEHKRPRIQCTGKVGNSLCDTKWKCEKCNLLLARSRKRGHKCGERLCKDCNIYYMYTDSHSCFMKPMAAPKPQSNYIFFDLETMQDTSEHIVNYCVAHRVCGSCIDIEDISVNCQLCGPRQFVFEGENVLDEFCKWLFNDANRGYTVLAHNLKGYDGHFLLNYLIRNAIKTEIIYNNTKIMKMEIKSAGIVLLDSLNHLPMKLSSMPKAFGLTALAKGFFPFFFNVPENQYYVGAIPDAKFYGVNAMYAEERREFLEWHASQKKQNVVFDFRKEIYKYTVSDVDILRKACLKFRKMVLSISKPDKAHKRPYSHGVDPFTTLTAASFCFTLYRHLFLKPNTMARVPVNGIEKDQFSKVSILWLDWVAHQSEREGKKINIQHALNGGEKRIGRYKCDGWSEETDPHTGVKTKVCYDFRGCFFHGCPTCYRPEVYNPKLDCSMGEIHRKTLEREQNIRDLGVEFISIWECQFRRDMKENPDIQKLKTSCEQTRLCPRDAFFGGRTNACRLFYKIKDDEKIKYYDFCSLYPYINKYGLYPIGHPTVITTDFGPLETYTGFAKVTVLPPRGVYHPVLPYRTNGKLLFPLCRTCCENELTLCLHSQEERAFVGTFVTLELNHAITKGYKVLDIHEVYHFPETEKYDQDSHKGGLFTGYINMFLKIKQQASGWPSWVKTEADKETYLRNYAEHEGISLDRNKIEINPGLRSISKICLNSFWGKLAERQGLKKSEFMLELDEFYTLVFDNSKAIENVRVITEEVILVEWVYKANFERSSACSNVYVAAFTTAQARLRLLSILEMLGERALYFDTDSAIFVSRTGEPEPPLGDFLGDLTNELPEGDYIETLVSGGPKNYAFHTHKDLEVCKVRGFSLNFSNSQTINFNSVKEMVQNVQNIDCNCVPRKNTCKKCSPVLTITGNKICRSKAPIMVFNREEKRDYRLCYTKRVIVDDYNTVPYGF